jgi:DNA sulfur modification protein DndB
MRGLSAGREALLGFAPAALLHGLSFADVLDEETGLGYQRRFSDQHSLDFRKYIRQTGSTTIPLTFNLRPSTTDAWRIHDHGHRFVELVIDEAAGKVLAQVDCQHRLGHIGDIRVELPFMIFVGLSEREEMEVFSVINSKAKGLSSSLLDLHDARLARDLASERPELLIALYLNDTETSPWYKQLDLGGKATSGLKRRASLRTMQKAVKRFLTGTGILDSLSAIQVARIVHDYWIAVATVLREQWLEPRRHFLTKGVGVYALMGVLSDIWKEISPSSRDVSVISFSAILSDFAPAFDWSNMGPLKGLGGESGALEALILLREARRQDSGTYPRLVHG